jgi:hypothetical protein
VEIKVIDYEKGLLMNSLLALGIQFEFIDLASHHWVKRIASSDTVFGFNNDIYCYPHLFKTNPKVFVYDVYYPFWSRFLRPLGFRLPFERFYLKKIGNSGLLESGIAFMEEKGAASLRSRIPTLPMSGYKIVPVSVDMGDLRATSVASRRDLRVTYIGRSEHWKLFPLIKFLEDIGDALDPGCGVTLHAVVSDVRMAKRMISSSQLSERLEIQYYENLAQSDLMQVVVDKTDIGFAMGTSVLEFAKVGVPCIVADFSHAKIEGEIGYRWLYEAVGFSLGRDLADANNREGRSLSELLDEYRARPSDVAKRCYEYARLNHSRDDNYARLLNYVLRSAVRAQDLSMFPSMVMHLFQEARRKIGGREKYERY